MIRNDKFSKNLTETFIYVKTLLVDRQLLYTRISLDQECHVRRETSFLWHVGR